MTIDTRDKPTATPRSFAARALIVFLCAAGAFTPACGPLPEDDVEMNVSATDPAWLEENASAITYDRSGRAYESKFERMGRKLLKHRAEEAGDFMQILEQTYGPAFDRTAAEGLRQKIMADDFSWTPPVQLVSAEELGGMTGGYSEAKRMVFLNDRLPNLALRTHVYLEELGHHLDGLLNVSDTPGDEGALFRMNVERDLIVPELHDDMLKDDHRWEVTLRGETLLLEFAWWDPRDWVDAAWNGIKGAAAWIGSKFKDVKSALENYARGAWNGSKRMAIWIKNNAIPISEATLRYLQGLPERLMAALKQSLNGAWNSLRAYGIDVLEGGKLIGAGIVEIGKGNFKDGVSAVMIGLVKITVEANVNSWVGGAMEAVGVIQVALGLEPKGRSLSSGEREYLGWIFGQKSWFDAVIVKQGWAGAFSLISDRPFTLENTIYLKEEPYSLHLLAHETTHVWQWRNNGGGYKIQSMYCQYLGGGGYDWLPEIKAGKNWSQLNVEQQGRLVADAAYSLWFVNPARDFLWGADNYTAQMRDAHAQIQAGRGAARWAGKY